MYKEYKVLCIMGKAGAGKDTLASQLLKDYPERFAPVVSFTSRPMREKEIDGISYHFISHANFILKIKTKEMLEWTYFNDWYYGTTIESFTKDKINVCVCNPQGMRSLKKLGFKVTAIYLDVDDKTRLLRQLNREEEPNVAEIIRRYSADEADFADLGYNIRFSQLNTVSPEQLAQYVVAELD